MVGNKVIHNQTKCKGLRVFEAHILKGRLYHTVPLQAQRSMQGRRHNACRSQWRWWFQRNSIFQTQMTDAHMDSRHWHNMYKTDTGSNQTKLSNEKGSPSLNQKLFETNNPWERENLFLPIQWHSVNHPRTGPTLIMDQYNTDSMLCFCFLLLLLIFICWFL